MELKTVKSSILLIKISELFYETMLFIKKNKNKRVSFNLLNLNLHKILVTTLINFFFNLVENLFIKYFFDETITFININIIN